MAETMEIRLQFRGMWLRGFDFHPCHQHSCGKEALQSDLAGHPPARCSSYAAACHVCGNMDLGLCMHEHWGLPRDADLGLCMHA